MNYVREYYSEIQSKKIVACEEIKSLYGRMVMETVRKTIRFLFTLMKMSGIMQ